MNMQVLTNSNSIWYNKDGKNQIHSFETILSSIYREPDLESQGKGSFICSLKLQRNQGCGAHNPLRESSVINSSSFSSFERSFSNPLHIFSPYQDHYKVVYPGIWHQLKIGDHLFFPLEN